MNRERAVRVVAQLRERQVMAHVVDVGVYRSAIQVVLADGREAIWDADGAAALDAQVMRDGVLVGLVATIPGSEDFDDAQTVEAIAGADYDAESDPGSAHAGRPPRAERGGVRETVPRPGLTDRLRHPGR